jgi:hypothetical protein
MPTVRLYLGLESGRVGKYLGRDGIRPVNDIGAIAPAKELILLSGDDLQHVSDPNITWRANKAKQLSCEGPRWETHHTRPGKPLCNDW